MERFMILGHLFYYIIGIKESKGSRVLYSYSSNN